MSFAAARGSITVCGAGIVGVGAMAGSGSPPTDTRWASTSIASRIAAALALIRFIRSATSSSVGAGVGTGAATTVCDVGAGAAATGAAATGVAAIGVAGTVGVEAGAAAAGAAALDSDSHGGGAHARGVSAGASLAATGSCSDPSTVVVLGCGASRCAIGSASTGRVGAAGRSAPEATTIVVLRGGVAGDGATCVATCGATARGASAACGFWLGSSHSPQYRHFTAAS